MPTPSTPINLSFIEPCSPILVAEPPGGERWIHEIKHDGFRTQLIISGREVKAFTRNGYDWSERYRPVIVAGAMLECHSAIIDGEMIVQREDGTSDFEALSAIIRRAPKRLLFYAFDLLHLNGQDLRDLPLLERRELLRELIRTDRQSPIQFSDHVAGDGPQFCHPMPDPFDFAF